ncbi:MAG: hypothetical protein KAX05_02205 [Bacteroidales bacterium]|nr:hypothetical protein [Bacteroidales bacterium]
MKFAASEIEKFELVKGTLLIVVFLLTNVLFAQTTFSNNEKRILNINKPNENIEWKKNSFFLELGGNAFFYSLNYDRLIHTEESLQISSRIGISHLGIIPIQLNLLIGGSSHHFEFGIGVLISIEDQNVLPTGTIGYRYQKLDGGFLFRIGITPIRILGFAIYDPHVIPWAGLSLGYSF